jgi:dTDP-4-amino-4,6-dideoxygalactose transaminase
VPIHHQEACRDLGLPAGTLSVTEQACDEILSLPMYPELTDAQIDWVIESVNAFQPAER